MRVLQLIDSLNLGGAERVAVNIANALAVSIEVSHLCVTRKEGGLKDALDEQVVYHFLGKRRSIDLKALFALKRIVKNNKIDVVHAHTTSFFMAAQLKMVMPSVKIIWHEHHGARIHSLKNNNRILLKAAKKFDHIITVNPELRDWWKSEMGISNVHYIPNFVMFSELIIPIGQRQNRIVCLANLREPKDHLNLLQAFRLLKEVYRDWKLLLVGKDLDDDYSQKVKHIINTEGLNQRVEILGERNDIQEILQNASIGVLSSSSEGLPMALLEYGLAGLAVVSTDVGNCAEVISTFGKVVPAADHDSLSSAIGSYMQERELLINDAARFREHIIKNYSSQKQISRFIKLYSD